MISSDDSLVGIAEMPLGLTADHLEPTAARVSEPQAGGAWQLVSGNADLDVDDVAVLHNLPDIGSFILGSHAECDIIVGGLGVTGKHCRLTTKLVGNAACVELRDLGSARGTFLNGRRVGRGARRSVKVGDVITLAAKHGSSFALQHRAENEFLGASASYVVEPLKTDAAQASLAETGVDDILQSCNLAELHEDARPAAQALPEAETQRLRSCASPPKIDSDADLLASQLVPAVASQLPNQKEVVPPTLPAFQSDLAQYRLLAAIGAWGVDASPLLADRAAALLQKIALFTSPACSSSARLVDLSSGAVWTLPELGAVTICWEPECDVVVGHAPRTCGRQCTLFCRGDGLVTSSNPGPCGTFLDSKPEPSAQHSSFHALCHGDRLIGWERGGPSLLFLSAPAAAA